MTASLQLGYLGPEGSHSHQAALRLVKTGVLDGEGELVPYGTLFQLMEAVEAEGLSLAVLPVENALEGAVLEVMEAIGLEKRRLQVHLEYLAPVNHCLIRKANGKPPGPVTTVISHPQALAQCRETLRRLFGPDVALKTAPSTSEAVRMLAEAGEDWAAIGTVAAARRYGMTVVQESLSDASDNMTRFLLVSKAGEAPSFHRDLSGYPCKTSLCMGLKDRPGVLVDILLVFKAYGINMTRIESRPSKRRFGDYLFYIDIDGNLWDPEHEKIRLYLEADTTYLKAAGPYACLGLLE